MSKKGELGRVQHVLAALILKTAGRPVTGENLSTVLTAAGVVSDPAAIETVVQLCRLCEQGGIPEAPDSPRVRVGEGIVPLSKESPPSPGRDEEEPPARPSASYYLYGVVPCEDERPLDLEGIGGVEVHTVVRQGLGALVHDWPPGGAVPEKEEEVRKWATDHLRVLEEAGRRFGGVLPVALGRLVGKEGEDPREVMRGWLEENAEHLRDRLRRLAGKQEYGLQVLWDPEAAAARLAGRIPELRRLKEEMKDRASGRAYLKQERYRQVLRSELEIVAQRIQREVLDLVQRRGVDFRPEKPKRASEGKRMILNLTCLLAEEEVGALSGDLDAFLNRQEGIDLRWTGPWPPYSFAA